MATERTQSGHGAARPGEALLDLALAVLLTIAAGIAAAVMAEPLAAGADSRLAPVLLVQGGLILLGVQLLMWRRGLRWRHIGLVGPRLVDLWRGLIALGLVFLVNVALSVLVFHFAPTVLEEHQRDLSGVADWLIGDLSLLTLLGVTFFIGFYEEVLARGFILDRCRRLLPGIWAPVILSSVLFGLGHLYQGWYGVVQTALVGVVFARLMLHWGSLWPLIIAHMLLNFLSLMVFRHLVGA